MEENDKPVDFGNYLTIGVSKEFKCSDGDLNPSHESESLA